MDSLELLQIINGIRKNKGYVSNAFLTKPQIDALLGIPETQVLTADGLLVVLADQKDYWRLYFYAQDEGTLQQLRPLLSIGEKPIVADVVGKNPQAENVATLIVQSGFIQYSTFVRMTCAALNTMGNVDCTEVETATDADIKAIFALLYAEFDPLFAHIPEPQEVTAAIEKKEITIIRRDKELAGLAYFQKTAVNSTVLRYFVVNERYRGQGIGTALLANTFTQNPSTMKYMLWIGTYNSAIELYRRLGFVEDGMIDYIMVYKGE